MKKERELTEEELFDAIANGIAPTNCPEDCEVEIDGECPHGYQSIFIEMGLV